MSGARAARAADRLDGGAEDRERYEQVLVDLLRHDALERGDSARFLEALLEAAARALGTPWVHAWLIGEDDGLMRCIAVRPIPGPGVVAGSALRPSDYPGYFTALEQVRTLAVSDVRSDERVRDFRDVYLLPAGIDALIEGVVRLGGRVVGTVSCEHRGGPRTWTVAEQSFVAALAELSGRALVGAERARAVADHRHSEDRWRRLIEGAGVSMWALGADGRITSANAGVARVLGTPREALLGMHFSAVAHPDDMPRALAIYARVLAGESPGSCTARVRHADGTWRTAELTLSPEIVGGRVVGVLGVGRDITEEARAERRTRILLEVARVAAGVLDPVAAMDAVLERLIALLPCRTAAVVQERAGGLRVMATRGLSAEELEIVAATPMPRHLSPSAPLGGGAAVALPSGAPAPGLPHDLLSRINVGSLVLAPLRTGDQMLGLLAVSRPAPNAFEAADVEICEAAAAQLAVVLRSAEAVAALREEAQVRDALARVGEALLAVTEEAPLLEQLCAMTAEACEADRASVWRLIPDEDGFELVAHHGRTDLPAGATGVVRVPGSEVASLAARLAVEDVVSVDDFSVFPDSVRQGTTVRRELAIALRRGSLLVGGMLVGRAADVAFTPAHARIARGVAQLTAFALANAHLVERLARADRLKSELVATLSHELRTPVNVILGYAQVVLDHDGPALPETLREPMARIEYQAGRLAGLVAGALDVSRLDSGHLPINWEQVAVDRVVAELVAEASARPRAPGVTLAADVAPGLPCIRTDRAKVLTVLSNLVGNALKFTTSGTIVVRAREMRDGVEIAVQDTGPGISRDEQASVFEVFRQGAAGRSEGRTGYGLGLYIVRRLVGALGGSVTLDSRVGEGSTFSVWLPGAGRGGERGSERAAAS